MTARFSATTTHGPLEPSRIQRAVLILLGTEQSRPRLAAEAAEIVSQSAEANPNRPGVLYGFRIYSQPEWSCPCSSAQLYAHLAVMAWLYIRTPV